MIRRLLSPEYWIVSNPGALSQAWLLYGAAALLFGFGMALGVWTFLGPKRRSSSVGGRAWAWFELVICSAGLGTVAGRYLGWPGWSARIGPATLAAMALLGLVAYRTRTLPLPGWAAAASRVLTFAPLPPTRSRWTHVAAFVPLLAGLGAALARQIYEALGITVTGWQGQAFPNPLTSLFYTGGILLAATAYATLCHLHVWHASGRRPLGAWRWASAGLLALTAIWAGWVYLSKRTHGATASDPYAYAQMAVDLAERGTFLHRFPLFRQVIPLNIAWSPLQPVGYHIPRNALGDCPSVWATGASVLLAAGYTLLGETGLYVTAPVLALLSLVATWALVHEALREDSRAVRTLTAALTVALTATSPEQVDRLLVPMADAAAQLFTVLTLLLILRAARVLPRDGRQGAVTAGLAGLAFACAYWVRHTQLVLALPAILALWAIRRERGLGTWSRAWPILLFAGAALAGALPDLVYRWRVFGGPLAVETTEVPAMALSNIGLMAWQTLRDSLVAGEWGYLFPFALLGALALARRHGRAAIVLGAAFAAVLVVHLTYRFLRIRDLLSIFPLVHMAAAYGAVSLVRWARGKVGAVDGRVSLGAALAGGAMVSWVVLGLALSRWSMIDNVWKPGWASFGYVRPDQRAAFDRLAELTPPDAVVGASLNAGAISLYSGRDAIRPYESWSEAEWSTFLTAMHSAGRTVYLFDDGEQMARFIESQARSRRLAAIEALPLPLFSARESGTGWLYRLEWEP